jgi:hypothetical protein
VPQLCARPGLAPRCLMPAGCIATRCPGAWVPRSRLEALQPADGRRPCSVAAFKTRPVSTIRASVNVAISPGLPSSTQSVGYSSNWELATFDEAEAACQKQCAHLATFTSLAEQVRGGGGG